MTADSNTAQRSSKSYAAAAVRIDLSGGPAVEVDLPRGARVVHGFVAREPGSRLIHHAGAPAPMIAVPMLVVVCDPKQPKERRRFFALPVGSAVDTEQELEPIATFTSDIGEMFVLFEARDAAVTS